MITFRKLLILFVLSISTLYSFSQKVDSFDIDKDPFLSKTEADFLNNYLKDQRKSFDFTNKKIAFITGSSGTIISNKVDYFNSVKEWQKKYKTEVATYIIVLTKSEKSKSGDYDAIIAYWVKVLVAGIGKDKLIERLKISR